MKIFRNIYGVYGMVEWSTLIPTGGSNLRIDFTNGSISTRGIDPATFTTDIAAVQAAIENSPKFKSGKIKKIKSFVIGEVPEEAAKEEKATKKEKENSVASDVLNGSSTDADDGKVDTDEGESKYAEVKNSQQARAILMDEPYNIPLADLGNKQAILGKAAELNVVFPNWN